MTFKTLKKADKTGFFSSAKHYVTGFGASDPTAEKILEEKKPKKKGRCGSVVKGVVMISLVVAALVCLLAVGGSGFASGRNLKESIPNPTDIIEQLEDMVNPNEVNPPTIRGATTASATTVEEDQTDEVEAQPEENEEAKDNNVMPAEASGEEPNDIESASKETESTETETTSTLDDNVEEAPDTPVSPSIGSMTKKLAESVVSAEKTEAPKPKTPPSVAEVQHCRDDVFGAIALRAKEHVLPREVRRSCIDSARTHRFDICDDLASFTGMTMEDVETRLSQTDVFHHEAEYNFWNPQTGSQLAWYYSASQGYLFRNAIRGAKSHALDQLKSDIHEPVLDYSGGAGNSILYLAVERGLKCQYFGIGMIEKAFAQFRVAKRDLQDMVTFVEPWSQGTAWKFDPAEALPRDGSLGAILANDVLSRIPDYQKVVTAMVDSLRVGGVILEESLGFATHPVKDGQDDTRMHVHNGDVSMAEAMGNRMIYREDEGWWEKIKDSDAVE